MFDHFLLTVNQWMTAGSAFAMAGAIAWGGMVSVLFSPCRLASIPLSWPTRAACRPLSTPQSRLVCRRRLLPGTFITIAVVGIVCALLGRMLGDGRLVAGAGGHRSVYHGYLMVLKRINDGARKA